MKNEAGEERELRRCRQFFQVCPQNLETLPPEVKKLYLKPNHSGDAASRNVATASPQSGMDGKTIISNLLVYKCRDRLQEIRQMPSAESLPVQKTQTPSGKLPSTPKSQTASGKLPIGGNFQMPSGEVWG